MKKRALLWSLAAMSVLAGGAALFFCDPAHAKFFPPCVFHSVTGLYCPGCGSTRAAHALLHGHVREAIGFNLLLVVVIPLLAWHFGGMLWSKLTRRDWRSPLRAPRVSWSIAVLVIGYFVLRNIPVAPFTALAPHASLEWQKKDQHLRE